MTSYSEPVNICFIIFSFLTATRNVHHISFLTIYNIFWISHLLILILYWTHAYDNVSNLQCFIQFTKHSTQGLMQQSHNFCSFKKAVHANLSFPFQHDF